MVALDDLEPHSRCIHSFIIYEVARREGLLPWYGFLPQRSSMALTAASSDKPLAIIELISFKILLQLLVYLGLYQ